MTVYTLFKVCYFGNHYHGSQRQPGLRTIEGELLKALHTKGYITNEQFRTQEIHSSGRTDSGVHARGMVYGFFNQRTEFHSIEINTVLPEDIIVWSSGESEVQENIPLVHPRYQAVQRHYKYYYPDLEEKLDSTLVEKAIKKLTGTHNFRNFSKIEKSIPTIRTIDEISASNNEKMWIFDFKARSFLWQQIRKMLRVILNIGLHKWTLESIDDLLQHEKSDYTLKIEPVSPDGLILWNIIYPAGVKFQICEKSKKRLISKINSWSEIFFMKIKMFKAIKNSF